MSSIPQPGAVATAGPFQAESQAHAAALSLGGPPRPGWSILSPEQSARMLTGACQAAGVDLGAFDERILTWLAGFEDSSCAVVAGLVARAHAAGGLDPADLRMVLGALSLAAGHLREWASTCGNCEDDPSGLCEGCARRLSQADGYDALAARLGAELPGVVAGAERVGYAPRGAGGLRCCYCHRSDRALRPHPDQPGELVCIDFDRCLKDMRARLQAMPGEQRGNHG